MKFSVFIVSLLWAVAAAAQTATIQGNAAIGGQLNVTNTTNSTSPTTGAAQISGGLGVGQNANIGGVAQIAGGLGVGLNANIGSILKVGTPGWLNAINSGTESIAATSSLSNTGQIGVIGAGKTADAGTNPTNVIGLVGYAWNNNTSTAEQAYGALTIARRGAGIPATNPAIGLESDAVEHNNYTGANGITPYNMGPTTGALSASLWAASGDGFDLPAYPTSVALGVIDNGAPFISGLVISSTSLYPRASGGFGRAIDMASTHTIHWDNSNPALATSLWADASGLHGITNTQTVPPAFPGNSVGWTLSSNFVGAGGEVDIWNGFTAPGPRVFSFRKKDTDTTQVELASINFGGELRMAKGAIFAAPGAGFGMLQWIAGTTAGTCKLVALAGTSATPTTIVDNVGSGC